jgi:hypothetical protein
MCALALPLAQSRLLPNDFKQQPNHAKADDNPDEHYRDKGSRLSLRLSFSCGYRV